MVTFIDLKTDAPVDALRFIGSWLMAISGGSIYLITRFGFVVEISGVN